MKQRALDEFDFPLATAGNLIMSPSRRDPVLVADSPSIAAQVCRFLNFQAATERHPSAPADWLKVH